MQKDRSYFDEDLIEIPLEVSLASEIKPKEVRWLWYPYIPFGKLTILQGDPGDGKSKLMLTLAALLTQGKPLPFCDKDESQEPMAVIYQTTEDDPEDTIVPRFIEAGGETSRLIFIKEDVKNLTFTDTRIRRAVEVFGAKLLILDPLSAYIGDSVSLNAANEMRAAFSSLAEMARDTGCAVVIVAHMNKMRETNPLYRTSGSIDIAGVARSILAVVRQRNREDPNDRIMVQVKSNLAPTGSGIIFRIKPMGIVFLEEIEITAEEAFYSDRTRSGRPSVKVDMCIEKIKEILKGKDSMPATECEALLLKEGYKKSTIRKAKKMAGVESEKVGFVWLWSIDSSNKQEQPFPEDEYEYDEIPF
ncbi:MAG: AAA family ATPase [Oscillospiraceae bacterium]|nr:AAA family ATPase [Oscillospiraceae bacterium]